MKKKYFVVAKYNSKYGQIVYATPFRDGDELPDLDNCYLNTFYFKGSEPLHINEVYEFETLKGENGLTYCFL